MAVIVLFLCELPHIYADIVAYMVKMLFSINMLEKVEKLWLTKQTSMLTRYHVPASSKAWYEL